MSTRPTPATDAIFGLIQSANHPETDGEHFRALMENARNGVEALEIERDDLAHWKQSALTVEAGWDAQRVGHLLNVHPGHPIQPAIEPGIRALQAKLAAARIALESITHDMGASQSIHDLCATTLNLTKP